MPALLSFSSTVAAFHCSLFTVLVLLTGGVSLVADEPSRFVPCRSEPRGFDLRRAGGGAPKIEPGQTHKTHATASEQQPCSTRLITLRVADW